MTSKKELVSIIVGLIISTMLIAYKENIQSYRHSRSDERSKTNKNDSILFEVVERINSTINCTFDKIHGTIGWQCSSNGECYQLSWICDNLNQWAWSFRHHNCSDTTSDVFLSDID